jgi:arginyl-tRNA synthetase
MGSQFDFEVLKEKITGLIRAALARGQADAVFPAELPEYEVTIELPRRSELGDLACNVAFRLAGKLRMPPRKLAELIASRISLEPEGELDRVEAAGGGFLNFLLKKRVWGSVL